MENIYELLNRAEMNLEEFENQKLSHYESRAAKKHILKKIRKMNNGKKAAKKIFAAAAACIVIIIGMSTISAAAGWIRIPDSLMTILGIHTDKELEAANAMGTSTKVAAVDHGYKITAEGIISDGRNMGIIFKIEKTDGSNLLDNGRVPEAVEFREIDNEDGSWFHGVTGNVDGSSQTDSIEYYAALTFGDRVEDHVFISLEDMQLWADDVKIDITGRWDFDIPFEVQDLSVDLAAGEKFSYGSSEGTIDELMISPIGFSVRITTADELSDSDFIDMPMEIHLKNKEVVELSGGCGPEDNDDGTWSWREDGVYDSMILLENIESVVIGDTEYEIK